MQDWFQIIEKLLKDLIAGAPPPLRPDPLTRPEFKAALAAKDIKLEKGDDPGKEPA